MHDRLRGISVAVLVSSSLLFFARHADASALDAGAEAGFVKRSLADTNYKLGFTWQLHADLALLPILTLGPYVSFAQGTPEIATDNASSTNFRTIGLRTKLKLPVPGAFTPYGVAGVGWVHGDFPDQVVRACDPTGTICGSKTLPSATANFAELLLGAGAMIQIAGPVAISAEFNWRPSIGYKNDVYEKQLQSKETSAPDPSRNGAAWVGLFGLALTL